MMKLLRSKRSIFKVQYYISHLYRGIYKCLVLRTHMVRYYDETASLGTQDTFVLSSTLIGNKDDPMRIALLYYSHGIILGLNGPASGCKRKLKEQCVR